MYKYGRKLNLIRVILAIVFAVTGLFCTVTTKNNLSYAMPFYDLNPKETVLRAQFYTSYPTSTKERKTNISIAAKSLDNTMIAPNEEFSFNRTVGERTVKRGYQISKIIVNGEFTDGVGGGVCQVSTTLYNAVLLAGLNVIEYHPHSLPVSYVSPSFDAMVNSGWADLKFLNNTHNPIIIRTHADGSTLSIEIFGEPMTEKYARKSVVTQDIPMPEYEVVSDDKGEFPDLYQGEQRIVKYGKAGYKSEGYLVTIRNGKAVGMKKIRSDNYAPTRGKIIKGTAAREITDVQPDNVVSPEFIDR